MIHLHNIAKRYDTGQDALTGVNLEVERGGMAFLTGHSGAGKSTLLRLIALIDRPTRGRLVIDGRDVTKLPARRIPNYRRSIGVVFQDHRLLPDRSVFDNVALPLVIAGYTPEETARRVRASLDKVGLLHKEKSLPPALSSGEQQRVGIARAVVNRPAILLADEPTGNLDPDLSREIMQLFLEFNEAGTTVLVASHDLALLETLDRPLIRLEGGRIVGVVQPPEGSTA